MKIQLMRSKNFGVKLQVWGPPVWSNVALTRAIFDSLFDLNSSSNKVICFWIHHMANILKKSQKNQFYFLKITFCNFFSGHLQVNKSEKSLKLLQFGLETLGLGTPELKFFCQYTCLHIKPISAFKRPNKKCMFWLHTVCRRGQLTIKSIAG